MSVPKEVVELVERFSANLDAYKSNSYNETQARRELIDPLFRALGWDVDNSAGYAESYKDVIHEATVRVAGRTKAPDYSFRIGGTRKFFVEAKRPGVNIREDPTGAYQLRRYAWSAKLPVSILTDFEEFAVYDGRVRPKPGDKASVARIQYWSHQDYLSSWEELASLFSKEAVLKGSFDRFAADDSRKRGTAVVDDAFLDDLEAWRTTLAKNFARNNPSLSARELNYAVQLTIDRIVFLRICEDRGIEPYGRLREIGKKRDVYAELLRTFRLADDRFNSGLFHFKKEKGRATEIDSLTPSIKVSDAPLKSILGTLYYPDSPYEFSVVSGQILGQAYERFLGSVISVGDGRRVTVEQKPEVRKAGGVYYTGEFIVDYIVNSQMKSMIEGKGLDFVRGFRVLDPACGSGSFLIAAYDLLLAWHLGYYETDDPERHARGRPPRLYRSTGGDWRLTAHEKKRILLQSIFGVDIDPQAVEVTKLSLLLKVLEGESDETVGSNLELFRERALPDLGENIRCGNSIFGTDYYSVNPKSMFDTEEQYRVNPFDWETEFPKILADGGFDIVIGNPPYFNVDETWGANDPRRDYLSVAYPHIYRDKTDVLFYFVAKAVLLAKSRVCFIVSRAFREAYKADKLREWLAQKTHLREIIDFRNAYLFPRVGITTAILTLDKKGEGAADVYELLAADVKREGLRSQREMQNVFRHVTVNQAVLKGKPWIFAESSVETLLAKIDAAGVPVGEVLAVGKGMETGANEAFAGLEIDDLRSLGAQASEVFERARNSDILRWRVRPSGIGVLWVEDSAGFASLPSGIQKHLECHRQKLTERAAFKRGDCEWWRFTWPLHRELVRAPRILCPYRAPSNRFAVDFEARFLGLTDTTVLFDNGQPESLDYISALLNSRLLTFRYRYIGKLTSKGQYEYFWNGIGRLPIVRTVVSGQAYQHLVELAKTLRSTSGAETPGVSRGNARQIEALEDAVNDAVYQLYGINDDERRIVERELGIR